MRREKDTAWVIDDNAKSRVDASEALRSVGIRPIPLATEPEFLDALSNASRSESRPDLVVLDLRLPWGDEAAFVKNALVGGLACLQRLQQEPATRRTPVIVFSAFVDDELVKDQLRPYRPAAIVDKLDEARLPLVAENVLPNRETHAFDVVRRVGLKGEHQLLRIGALVGAGAAIVALIVSLVNWLT